MPVAGFKVWAFPGKIKRRILNIKSSSFYQHHGEVMEISSSRYTNVSILLHWLIAILMIFMLFFGENLIRQQTDAFYPSVHVSLGVSILVLSLARLAWRFLNPPPPLPAGMKKWEVTGSHVSHFLFYVLMIGLPLSGMMSFTSEVVRDTVLQGATVFGLFGAPQLPNIGGIGGAVHGLGSNLGQAIVILHVAAALKHQFWDKDNLLNRMKPH
jgi:cytochrome b561